MLRPVSRHQHGRTHLLTDVIVARVLDVAQERGDEGRVEVVVILKRNRLALREEHRQNEARERLLLDV